MSTEVKNEVLLNFEGKTIEKLKFTQYQDTKQYQLFLATDNSHVVLTFSRVGLSVGELSLLQIDKNGDEYELDLVNFLMKNSK